MRRSHGFRSWRHGRWNRGFPVYAGYGGGYDGGFAPPVIVEQQVDPIGRGYGASSFDGLPTATGIRPDPIAAPALYVVHGRGQRQGKLRKSSHRPGAKIMSMNEARETDPARLDGGVSGSVKIVHVTVPRGR